MNGRALLTSLLRYKAKADCDLLEALAADDSPGLARQSALRILHHIEIVDRIFAAHLDGQQHDYTSTWLTEPPALEAIAAAMTDTDRWLADYATTIAPEALDERIPFRFTDGAHGCMSRAEMLAHTVTHSGYHRGEIIRLLPSLAETGKRDIFTGYLHEAEPERRA